MDIAAVGLDHPDVAVLVAELQADYAVRYGGGDVSVLQPLEFRPPGGLVLLGRLSLQAGGGPPVAMAGFRRHAAGQQAAEIKRMYVRAPWRGRGLAREMLARLESEALAAGYRHMVLFTGARQPEALALYEAEGYRPTDPWGPYADSPLAHFLAKALAGAR